MSSPALQQRGLEYLQELDAILARDLLGPAELLPKLRRLLEDICKDRNHYPGTRYNLCKGLNTLTQQYSLSKDLTTRLHNLRLAANNVLHARYDASTQEVDSGAQAIEAVLAIVYQAYRKHLSTATDSPQVATDPERPDPAELFAFSDEPETHAFELSDSNRALLPALLLKVIPDQHLMHVQLEDDPEQQLRSVRYYVPEYSDAFKDAGVYLAQLLAEYDHTQTGVPVNLLDVKEKDGVLLPRMIVIEPEYLVDVTAISERFDFRATHPETELFNNLAPEDYNDPKTLQARQLGSITNWLFDELVARRNNPEATAEFIANYAALLFKQYPLMLTYLFAHSDGQHLKDTLANFEMQIQTMRKVIQSRFENVGDDAREPFRMNMSQVFVEPAFYSPRYGIQGRLDLMSAGFGQTANTLTREVEVIELKGGKPPQNPYAARESHMAQATLYQLLLDNHYPDFEGQLPINKTRARIFYSKATPETAVRFVPTDRKREGRAIHTRNALLTQRLCLGAVPSAQVMPQLQAAIAMLKPKLSGFRLQDIVAVEAMLYQLDDTERSYYAHWLRFLLREKYIAKLGGDRYGSRPQREIWSDKTERRLVGLELSAHHLDEDPPTLQLELPEGNADHNFRRGDAVMLYTELPRKGGAHSGYDPRLVPHYKGNIVRMDGNTLTVRLRHKQLNEGYFRNSGQRLWAIEADVIDNSYDKQLRALSNILCLPEQQRQRLLGICPPAHPNKTWDIHTPELTETQRTHLSAALSAPDYYLLVGPPGTGKTGIYLKHLVHNLYAHTSQNILLGAFTNRAVDEVCEKLEQLNIDYLRVGSRNGTAEQYQSRLIDRAAEACGSRAEVQAMLQGTRVVVGTLASFITKPELFALKQFDTAIIDEASQALEPQLLPVLQHVRKFILIGDPRQLPAIVVQPETETAVTDPLLHAVGIKDLRVAYFERLLATLMRQKRTDCYCLLRHQGRMHQELMAFPNTAYYENQLVSAEQPSILERQTAVFFISKQPEDSTTPWLTHRLAWVDCPPESQQALRATEGSKACPWEISPLLRTLNGLISHYLGAWKADQSQPIDEFLEDLTTRKVGIITPYRDQIARIYKELNTLAEHYDLPQLNQLMVDTVERYQGSQRDHILVSFSTKASWQLDTLSTPDASASWLQPDSDLISVDRKLNVLLTRAKEQLILFGNRQLLAQAPAYDSLLTHIANNGELFYWASNPESVES